MLGLCCIPRPFLSKIYIPITSRTPMSLSRSPSPVPGGGWSSPGLDITASGRSSPIKMTFSGSNAGAVTWESARTKSQGVAGYPSFSTQNQGFFTRNMRRISSSLPSFSAKKNDRYTDKDLKIRPALWRIPFVGRIRTFVARMSRRWKVRSVIAILLLACYILFYITRRPLCYHCLVVTLTWY